MLDPRRRRYLMTTAKAFTVNVEVVEDGPVTEAQATLAIGGDELVASGKARRSPGDPERPLIGDELAIARSLLMLARQLGDKVDEGVTAYEGHEVHVSI
jgi:citrate lyase beta subunit